MFKVKLNKPIHGFTDTNTVYEADSEFRFGKPKVKIHIPNSVIVMYVNWEDVSVQ